MHYWLLTIVLLLSAFNQNEQNMVLTESVFTLICPGNNITSCQPVNYIMLVIFTSSPLAVRRNDLSWHPTWSGRFISPSPGAVIGTGQNQWRSDTELAPRCDLCVNWHKTSGRIVGLTIKRWDREGLKPHLSLSKQHQPSWVWKDRGCLFIGSRGSIGGVMVHQSLPIYSQACCSWTEQLKPLFPSVFDEAWGAISMHIDNRKMEENSNDG